MWCHLPTGFQRRFSLRIVAATSLVIALITTLLFANVTSAVTGINKTINFQGRLLNAQGATVPDGYYNIQFKIYQDGDGQSANNSTGSPAGSLEWTETHVNNNANGGVLVKNGFLSVNLGAKTAFGTSVDWNQDTLWLSMNVAGSAAACTSFGSAPCAADGEMLPMKRMTATPYAMNAGAVGGKTAENFVQLAQGVQTDASTNTSSIFINKTSTGNLIQLQNSATDIFTVTNTGSLTFGSNANQAISVAASAASTTGRQLSVSAGAGGSGTGSTGGSLVLQGGAGGGTNGSGGSVTINGGARTGTGTAGSINIGTANAANTIQIGSTTLSGGTQTINIGNNNTSGGTTNLTIGSGSSATGGTTAIQSKSNTTIATNGVTRATFDTSGNLYLGNGASAATPNNFTIQGTASSTSGTAGGSLSVQGGTANTGNSNGGALNLNGGNKIGTGTAGGVNIGTANIGTIQIGSVTAASGTQTINVGTNATAGSTTTLKVGSTVGTSTTTIQGGSGGIILTGQVTASSTVDAVGGFKVNGTDGSTVTCTGGQVLQNSVVQGGIVTGGTCASVIGGSGSDPTLQDIYNNSGATPMITLTGTGNGVIFRDNATPIGGNLFVIQNNAQNINYLSVTASGTNITGTLSVSSTINNATISGGTLSGGTFSGGSVSGGTLSNTGLTFGAASSTVGLTTAAASTAGGSLTVQAGTGGSGTGSAGGALNLQGGAAGGTNANGGDVNIVGGTGTGTGVSGLVTISTPTFKTSGGIQTCTGATMAISQSSVDNSGTILVSSTYAAGQCVVSLPDPTIQTAGRVVYITADNTTTNNFTLSVNSGGTGNEVAMRANTSATMVWNGNNWAAAGASSSTTLQAAYDNTIQGSGGAELIVSSTNNTHGLTIRDSSVNPVNGALVSIQSSSAADLFSVNSNVTEFASNPGAETAGGTPTSFPASTWSALGASTVSREIDTTKVATGQGSVSTVTTAAVNVGAKNTLTSALTPNQHYNVSFTAKLSSGIFTDMNVYYSVDGTTNSVTCAQNQAVKTSVWTKINCTFTAPSSGITSSNAILLRQAGATARTFYIDNLSITLAADFSYATDGGVDDNTNFATNWPAVGAATVTRDTTVGNDASSSTKVVTSTANTGTKNKLSVAPLPSTLYRVTFYTAATAAFNTIKVQYTHNNSTLTDCVDYNTTTISTTLTDFTKITCYVTTPSNAVTNPYVYFTQTDASAHTWYIDTFSMTLASNSTPNVQIGGGVNGGPTTLFTLDRGASAPIAGDNEAMLGSMYYDTTLGKLQCYEADGWGACGSSPDNIVTISPEYNNAVMHGSGVGTMTSDICSDALNINDGSSSQPTICAANQTFNFYKWTSPQATTQSYSIFFTYQLPSTFKTFASSETYVDGRIDHATNAGLQYQVYRSNDTSGLTTCGGAVTIVSSANTWNRGTATGASDPSTCGFLGGDSIVFKISMSTRSNANAYVGNLGFTFSNR